MKKIPKKTIVYIEWRDSNVYSGQRETKDTVEVAVFATAGILIESTKDRVIVAREQELTGNKDIRGTIVIPRENILTYRKIA